LGILSFNYEWGSGSTRLVVRVHGTLDIYVRTASKYDDGHLLHLPNLAFQIKMDWVCLANPKVGRWQTHFKDVERRVSILHQLFFAVDP
jgi:hypothetical protein